MVSAPDGGRPAFHRGAGRAIGPATVNGPPDACQLAVVGPLGAPADSTAAGEQRTQRLLALHNVVLTIGGQGDSQQTLELILDQACGLLAAPAGTIYVMDEESGTLHCRAWRNVPPDYPDKPLQPGEGSAGEAFCSRQTIIVNSYRADPLPRRRPNHDSY